jgi:hypothetical protein
MIAAIPDKKGSKMTYLEPLEACLFLVVEEPPFDAQGSASIPDVGGVVKAQYSQTMFPILYAL